MNHLIPSLTAEAQRREGNGKETEDREIKMTMHPLRTALDIFVK